MKLEHKINHESCFAAGSQTLFSQGRHFDRGREFMTYLNDFVKSCFGGGGRGRASSGWGSIKVRMNNKNERREHSR